VRHACGDNPRDRARTFCRHADSDDVRFMTMLSSTPIRDFSCHDDTKNQPRIRG
jgi:hypothetical protein